LPVPTRWYDDLGRVYRTIVYGVDPNTGTVGNSLTSKHVVRRGRERNEQLPAGSARARKQTYDSLERLSRIYVGYT